MISFVSTRVTSFRHAFNGLFYFIKTQPHAWIHSIATVFALSLSAYFSITQAQWLAIILVIGLVWVAEALNTAIEKACDAITLEHNPNIKLAKDVAAGAVLIAALVSLVVAGVVFTPYFLS